MSIKGRQPDMRMSLRLREREARRSRYLDIPRVVPRVAPGSPPVEPRSAWIANGLNYILTKVLLTN